MEMELITKTEDAAGDAIIDAIQNVAAKHKPADFMYELGVMFAQGLAAVSEKCRDEALEGFFERLYKYNREGDEDYEEFMARIRIAELCGKSE
jgi:hypothetical protein